MNSRSDFTRWNRAGLSKFRYVDGNAVTYLEVLRRAMVNSFTEDGVLRWEDLEKGEGTAPGTPRERLLAQYHGERKDHAWEIMRTLARASHVLTEHLDAYSNESFLGTATQWDNVRKLVEAIDYHPAPPASASTYLALHVNDEGTVEAGFQVKNQPADGSKPSIFETLEDLEVDPLLNTLQPVDWNQSQEDFAIGTDDEGEPSATIEIEALPDDVSTGALGVLVLELEAGETALPVVVTAIDDPHVTVRLLASPAETARKSQVRLLLGAQAILTPLLRGEDTVEVDTDLTLVAGERLAWKPDGTWYTAEVVKIQNRRIQLSNPDHQFPRTGDTLYRMAISEKNNGRIIIPPERGDDLVWGKDFSKIDTSPEEVENEEGDDVTLFDVVDDSSLTVAHYIFAEDAAVGTVIRAAMSAYEFSGSPGDLASGQWMVPAVIDAESGEISSDTALQIASIVESQSSFRITFTTDETVPGSASLYGVFVYELHPDGHEFNEENLAETADEAATQQTLALEADSVAPLLARGRLLIVRNEEQAELVTVVDATSSGGKVEVVVEPALQAEFRKHDTVILGNVVLAGHGESQPSKALGRGDATQTSQEMVFKMTEVSFVLDSLMPSGVAAAIDLTIDNQTWQQVATLNDSEPEDPHYQVRLTQDGLLSIRFGDGIHGRRLPTGRGNVRIVARLGVGLAGNLPAGSLIKDVVPHPLVDELEQPLAASGGNDLESIDSLRANAPASVLALQRAVSLSDFSALAASNSGVWQARARHLASQSGRRETVEVALVPAGGGTLGTLAEEIAAFLQSHTAPGISVRVVDFRPLPLHLDVTIQVKSEEYDADAVIDTLRSTLQETFSLENRGLGDPLFRSEIFAVIERISGVENCACTLRVSGEPRHIATGSDDTVRSIRAWEDQLIYIDPHSSSLDLRASEFVL